MVRIKKTFKRRKLLEFFLELETLPASIKMADLADLAEYPKSPIGYSNGVYQSMRDFHQDGFVVYGSYQNCLYNIVSVNKDAILQILGIAPEIETERVEEVKEEETQDFVLIEQIEDYQLVPYIEGHVQLIRNKRVMLDRDLSSIYGVETKRLNQQRERNPEKFPEDFAFQLTASETSEITLQNATLQESEWFRHNPWAYTPEGCNMAATVLNSPQAIKRSVQIIRTFSDLERMAYGEQPQQPNFAVLVEEIVNRMSSQFGTAQSKFEATKERQDLLKRHFELFGEPAQTVKKVLQQAMLSEIMGENTAPTMRESDLWYAHTFWIEKKQQGYLNQSYQNDNTLVKALGMYASQACRQNKRAITAQPQLLGNNRIADINLYPFDMLERALQRMIEERKIAHQKVIEMKQQTAKQLTGESSGAIAFKGRD